MGLLNRVGKEQRLAARFDAFVSRALATQFDVSSGEGYGCDLVLVSADAKLRAVVEAKLHRSAIAAASTVRNAAARLQLARNAAGADVCILVLNTSPDPFIEAEARKYGVLVYDAEILRGFAITSSELLVEFESIQQEALLVASPIVSDVVMPPRLEALPQKVALENVETGRALWSQIQALPTGDGTAYEELCTKALQYLFASDLTAWIPQKRTDALHRFDLIARVSSRNDFWQCLRERFGGQYVVFEFKNHSAKISQSEIYTTEKYLYPNALRSVGIIFSRIGPDKHALAAAKGALRESGKLILNCTDEDLEAMLLNKDQGDEPANLLLRIMDEMLMSIER